MWPLAATPSDSLYRLVLLRGLLLSFALVHTTETSNFMFGTVVFALTKVDNMSIGDDLVAITTGAPTSVTNDSILRRSYDTLKQNVAEVCLRY